MNAPVIEIGSVVKTGRPHQVITQFALTGGYQVTHAGKVLTHNHIMREVWGPHSTTQTHYLRVYIKHLREKLEQNPSDPKLIITEPGVGYRLLDNQS